MNAADADTAPTPDRTKPVNDPRRGGRLKIWARENGGARVRFVSDDVVVRDADLVEVAFFDRQAEAAAVAQACADILTLAGGTAPDQYGWHTLPPGSETQSFVANILEAARAQSGALAPVTQSVRRRWTRDDDVYFAYLVGQGYSAKGIAAELGITVMNVYKHANRLGLSLADRTQHVTAIRLPADVLARLDGLAQTGNMRRDTFLSRWVTKAVRGDPGRYGLVAI